MAAKNTLFVRIFRVASTGFFAPWQCSGFLGAAHSKSTGFFAAHTHCAHTTPPIFVCPRKPDTMSDTTPPKKRRKVSSNKAVLPCGHAAATSACMCTDCFEEKDRMCLLCDINTDMVSQKCDADGCTNVVEQYHAYCEKCEKTNFCHAHHTANLFGPCNGCYDVVCGSCKFGTIDEVAVCLECVWRCTFKDHDGNECGATPTKVGNADDENDDRISGDEPVCQSCDKMLCDMHMRHCDTCDFAACNDCYDNGIGCDCGDSDAADNEA
jgi:hypothetical protein